MSQQQTTHIVFQCYGQTDIFNECAFALLSLSQLYRPEEFENFQIWIYTDNPEWFLQNFRDCPLPVIYKQLNEQIIKQWKGEIDFVHRVKIEVLRELMLKNAGNILYADTDVVFIKRIDPMLQAIQNGNIFMHVMEGIVSEEGNPILKKLCFYLREQQTIKLSGKPLYDYAMWNAGVLGFHTQYHALLDDILFFTDMVHPEFPKHVVEQFAFSVYFQRAKTLHAAAPYIVHYWNMKELRILLASFFNHFKNKSWDELTELSKMIQVHVIMQEKLSFLQNRSALGKLTKTEWEPKIPDWNLLMQQL
jgi:hypothetical protein